MLKIFRILLVSAIFWTAALAADTSSVVEGRADLIRKDKLVMGSQQYKIIYPATEEGKKDAERYGFETECWVAQSPDQRYQIDCITLVHVGYADLVRLSLQDDVVRSIEVLDLQQ